MAGASKVTTLELQDATTIDGELVLCMIESCKALKRSLYNEKVKMLDHEGVRQARPAYQSILNRLLKGHSASPKYLELSPDSTDPCIDRYSEDILTRRREILEYPRLEGFVGLTALEELRVPMSLLTGRPKGKSIGNAFEPETRTSWGRYIGTEWLLPLTLTKLLLTMGPVLSPVLGCDYSDLLDFITRHNRITHLNIEWKYYMYQEQLPIDFYNLKRWRASFDCKFDYLIFVRNSNHNPNRINPESNKTAFDERLDGMAEWLATYGEAGIEMALHFVDGSAKCHTAPQGFGKSQPTTGLAVE
ncbi:hypothetical protein B5807_04840 [Epicoccum nigrum]|uniref:Uncharacterized protein n=1 Tax=Epicoccum nigrum TaxID=105696 RepID=A0A1Y2M2A9_EPING|nr:hypothetical protein B5807_04840 [Epicoccum nigrum]